MSAFRRIVWVLIALAAAAGCQPARVERPAPTPAPAATDTAPTAPSHDAGWWRDRVFYEIFVRSFADSSTGPLANDGVGDFQGLIERLDYLNDGDPATTTDLGITGIWLMPISPSPSYHGYDVTDYYDVNPQYGTRDDFRRFLAECHNRGIRVIVDLVLNHSSSRHQQFKGALRDDPAYRDWYIFVPPDRVPQVRGPWDQVVWHEANGKHYYGIFWSGMPDLNYRTPAVTAEAYRIAEFWLREMGADGFRLDAIRHLIEDGDVMSDTPETVAWLQAFQSHVRSARPDVLTVGEVWAGTEIVSDYIHAGALDLAFEFDLAAAIIDAAKSGTRDKLAYSIDRVAASYPDGRYATMITNHDQNRVASELQEDPARMKLAATLLLTLPGVPFIYYGEEIGQIGAKPDEMIRNPMPWTGGTHGGFTSAAQPWEPLQPGHELRNVVAQDADASSLLNHYRRLVRLRQSEPVLSRGGVRNLETGRSDVIAWERALHGRRLTMIANLSGAEIQDYRLPGTADARFTAELIGGVQPGADGSVTLTPRSAYLFVRAGQ
jgi:glycosidase